MGRTFMEVLGDDGEYHPVPTVTTLFTDPSAVSRRIQTMVEQQSVIRTLFGEPPKPTRRQRVRRFVMRRREGLARKLAPWAVD